MDDKEPNWSPATRALMDREAALAKEIHRLDDEREALRGQIAAAKVADAAPVHAGDLVRHRRTGKVFRVAYVRHSWGNRWDLGVHQRLKDGSFSESGRMLDGYSWEPMPAEG